MKKLIISAIIIVLVLVGLENYLSHQRTAPVDTATPSPQPTITTDASPSQVFGVDQFIQASPDTSTLKAGGSSYSDPQGVFSFLYPNDYTIDHSGGEQFTRIYKRGSTQRPQSEISDGVLVVFERVNLGGKTLSDWVDAQIEQAKTAGSEITQPKKEITLNDFSGYTYAVRSLGESTYVVLRKDPNSDYAVSITSLVADPQQKGYQKEVDAILATLDLRK